MRFENANAFYVLLILTLLDSGPAFGDEIGPALSDRSGGAFEPKDGRVHAVLLQLERAGFVTSLWRQAVRRRRLYEITGRGRAERQSLQATLRQQVDSLDRLFSAVTDGISRAS